VVRLQIDQVLTHKKPWVLIDRILQLVEEKGNIVTLKHISMSDYFITGHFASYSVYPGMLLLEGMKQSAEALIILSQLSNGPFKLSGKVAVRFLRAVLPGNTLTYKVSTRYIERGNFDCQGEGEVDGQTVVRATWSLLTGGNHAE
jgi:3-hydroxyacyl-[acyl-carrier-protein] dehydratase